jgi:hypothetical protein
MGRWADRSRSTGRAHYAELELAMQQGQSRNAHPQCRAIKIVEKYRAISSRSLHKMNPIPVFKKSYSLSQNQIN